MSDSKKNAKEDAPYHPLPVTEPRDFSIDSRHASSYQNGDSLSSLSFVLPGMFAFAEDIAYVTFEVQTAQFENVFYNLREDYTWTLYYVNDTTSATTQLGSHTISAGFYDIYTLLKFINDKLPSTDMGTLLGISGFHWLVINNLQFEYLPNQMRTSLRLRYSSNEDFAGTFIFESSLFQEKLGFSSAAISIATDFDPTSVDPFHRGVYNLLIAAQPPSLRSVKSIFIYSDTLPGQNFSTSTGGSYVGEVPVTADFGDTIVYEDKQNQAYPIYSNTFSDNLSLRLLDDEGNLLNFLGQHWKLQVRISYVRRDVGSVTESMHQTLHRLLLEAQVNSERRQKAAAAGKALTIDQEVALDHEGTPYIVHTEEEA